MFTPSGCLDQKIWVCDKSSTPLYYLVFSNYSEVSYVLAQAHKVHVKHKLNCLYLYSLNFFLISVHTLQFNIIEYDYMIYEIQSKLLILIFADEKKSNF